MSLYGNNLSQEPLDQTLASMYSICGIIHAACMKAQDCTIVDIISTFYDDIFNLSLSIDILTESVTY